MLYKIQTAFSEIWTRVTVFISYDKSRYIMSDSLYIYIYIYILERHTIKIDIG